MAINIYIYIHIHICTFRYVYIHVMYVYIYTHTHINTRVSLQALGTGLAFALKASEVGATVLCRWLVMVLPWAYNDSELGDHGSGGPIP